MTGLEDFVINYVLNAIWQAPLVLLAAWCTAWLARDHGPEVEHRVWITALALEVGIPALPQGVGGLIARAQTLCAAMWTHEPSYGQVSVTFGPALSSAANALHLPAVVESFLIHGSVTTILLLAVRLIWRTWSAERLLRRATPVALPLVARARWQVLFSRGRWARALPEVAISGEIRSPVTAGLFRSALLLPRGLLEQTEEEDLDSVLAHEATHILRGDVQKNLLYRVLTLPVAWHPVVTMTLIQVAASREMICDQAAGEALLGRERYARSLLRLAALFTSPPADHPLHAIGIFGANTLERRVMKLTETMHSPRRLRRFVNLAACGLIAVATCSSALALRLNVEAHPGAAVISAPGQIKVAGGIMAGQVLKKTQPVYPVQAKADKNIVDGPVVLDAIIGKDGKIEKLTVLKSLREDYDKSALDAVRDWEYKPYLLNGEPTEVETTITVTYSTNP